MVDPSVVLSCQVHLGRLLCVRVGLNVLCRTISRKLRALFLNFLGLGSVWGGLGLWVGSFGLVFGLGVHFRRDAFESTRVPFDREKTKRTIHSLPLPLYCTCEVVRAVIDHIVA